MTTTVPVSLGSVVADTHVSHPYVRRDNPAGVVYQGNVPDDGKNARTRCSKDQLGTILRVPKYPCKPFIG